MLFGGTVVHFKVWHVYRQMPLLLGFVLETLHGKDLLAVWKDLQATRYPGSSLAMHEDNRPLHAVDQYAPTELCPWRKKRLQGEVHDDNTWSFGGISTHAGLFGSIDDLSGFGLQLRAQGTVCRMTASAALRVVGQPERSGCGGANHKRLR